MFATPANIDCATKVVDRLAGTPGLVWLDSNRHEGNDGRFSFVGVDPVEVVEVPYGQHPLPSLTKLDGMPMSESNEPGLPSPSDVPRWIGYIGYDATWPTETRNAPRDGWPTTPVVWFGRYDALFMFDHKKNQSWIVGDDEDACDRLAKRVGDRNMSTYGLQYAELESDSPAQHRQAIQKALDYIRRGEIYQVNLARRWSVPFDGEPLRLWQAMRQASEVPLGLFLDVGDHALLACTMERFLRWHRETGRLTTRPIKGTLATDPTRDVSPNLRADPKEQAEHVMIVDLMRNDLGRVATIGSVQVEQPMVVEPFTGLYHLVSTVACTTRHDITFADIIEATFPPGSVTGAPKIRAIKIIEELESHPREVYCGCVGFVDRAGGCSMAVSIRTALVRDQHAYYWAGGGLVSASDVDREVAETDLKAEVFLRALKAMQA